MESAERLPIVGVMGSGGEEHDDLAAPLGAWLARAGVHLLTGGGSGVMLAVSRGFARVQPRRGFVLGVLPADADAPGASPPGYPNPFVEVALRTHLPLSGTAGEDLLSRNHINVLSADVVLALPGAAGTASEVRLARRYGRPVAALLHREGELPAFGDDVPRFFSLEDASAWLSEVLSRR